jgi:nucleoside-diphosphate-sugar epimerase
LRILVTGGAGYIGSVLVPSLLFAGHEVTVLDNFMYGKDSLSLSCINPGLEIYNGDCRDVPLLVELISKVDVVIPLAAIVGFTACNRDFINAETTNFHAIDKLCIYIPDSKWIIFPATNSGYGVGGDGFCTEDSPITPISLYGRTKVLAEQRVLQRERSISLRLATVFGASPRMRTDLLVNDLVLRAVRDRSLVLFEGDFRRNFIHVRDVANAILFFLSNLGNHGYKIYNCGNTSINMSKRKLCESIKAKIPELVVFDSDKGEDPDKRDYVVSNERLEAEGFECSYGIDAGIEELCKLYKTLGRSSTGNV